MTLASGSRVQLTYVEESTRGTTPGTPSMKVLRTTSPSVNPEKDLLENAEVRGSRQESDVRHGATRVIGNVGFQLSRADYDDWIAYALAGTWAAPSPTTITASATANEDLTFSEAPYTVVAGSALPNSGDWIANGYRPGMQITGASFVDTDANATFTIARIFTTSGANDTIEILETPPWGTGSKTAGNFTGASGSRQCDVGTTLKTVSLERGFLDVTQFQVFKGVAINQMEFRATPTEMIGGTFTLLGMEPSPLTGTSLDASPDAATDNNPFSAFEGALYEGGTLNAVVTELTFTLDNRRTLSSVLGSKYSPDVFEGTARLEGQITALFENATLLNKFINETESSLMFSLDDPNGTDKHTLYFPRIKYIGGSMDPEQEGPVPLVMPFRALEDTTDNTILRWTRSNT